MKPLRDVIPDFDRMTDQMILDFLRCIHLQGWLWRTCDSAYRKQINYLDISIFNDPACDFFFDLADCLLVTSDGVTIE
jgi:hypothetical protein